MPQADNGGPPPASGRASYRGGGREARPGASGEGMRAPADELQSLALAEGGRGGRRRLYGEEPHTRPAHISDKKGLS